MSKPTRILMALALFAGACGSDRQAAGERERTAESGMEGRQGMHMPSTDSLPVVRAYLDSLVRAEPGDLTAVVAGHRDRMERMLSAMDQDMKAMNMAADAAWQALADSVRADLGAIPGLSGEQLVLRMRAHAGRMRRLLVRHEGMMSM